MCDSTRQSGDSVRDLGVAILNVDLSGATEAQLTFQQLESLDGDTNQALPDQHVLKTNGDAW